MGKNQRGLAYRLCISCHYVDSFRPAMGSSGERLQFPTSLCRRWPSSFPLSSPWLPTRSPNLTGSTCLNSKEAFQHHIHTLSLEQFPLHSTRTSQHIIVLISTSLQLWTPNKQFMTLSPTQTLARPRTRLHVFTKWCLRMLLLPMSH